ncbi:hypothetical protein UFOVP326_83 [uncultured Caudovirales phage]|uniref:Uncharacterized protein n=1 Tax=uncultured Caudovirales phage TaxID=2100421 RepID=A0A6J5LTK2_9CAUD|nr:hypothetical protein UFOVP326_83 [uncultured Caudovirales phage]
MTPPDGRVTPNQRWVLVDHACRHCLGRMARNADEPAEFRCTTCEATSVGGPQGVCACGIRVQWAPRGEAARSVTKRARFHCGPNPDRGFRSPAVVVVLFNDGAGDRVVEPESPK